MFPVPALSAFPWKYIFAVIAFCAAVFAIEQFGEGRVYDKWDKAKAEAQRAADREKLKNEEASHAVDSKRLQDIAAARTEGSRAAVAEYIRTHRLRPVRPGGCEAGRAEVADGATPEQGSGDGLDEFAMKCALDAAHVLRWQELAIREGWEVK